MFIPSIDLYDGKAVQWRRGREPVLEREDVFALLDEFSVYPEIAVIDLNAATGAGSNRVLIEKMLRRRSFRVGGGVRDVETARAYLKAGASKIIIGTAAREPWVRELPKQALIFALDSKGDSWLTDGWRVESGDRTEDVLDQISEFCSGFLYTQVEKEGMLTGLDRERAARIVARSPVPVTIAGGITTSDDLRFIYAMGAHAQIGMALYTGLLKAEDCFLAGVDFAKSPLTPTVVQDVGGDVLMLAYSNEASLRAALAERRGVYFSRSRNQLWRKGETSGHVQQLVRVDVDCDGDALLFTVRQKEKACHFNRWSCFPAVDDGFSLKTLDATLQNRKNHAPADSFTARLYREPAFLAEKLREETGELIEAETFEETRWEASDLLYFTLVAARSRGVGLDDIIAELRSRHGNR